VRQAEASPSEAGGCGPHKIDDADACRLRRPKRSRGGRSCTGGNDEMFLWFMKASGSTTIDVTLPETIAGVAALVAAGVLSAEGRHFQ
jgi:hypothetical protein